MAQAHANLFGACCRKSGSPVFREPEAKALVLNNAGVLLEQKGDFAGALDHYDQAAKINVIKVIFQRNTALLLCKLGRAEEAIRRLRGILSIDPDDPETLQILAVANELAAGDLAKKQTLPAAQTSHRKAGASNCLQ